MLNKPIYILNKKINWSGLSYNKNDLAIDILENNIDKIDWCAISYNENPRTVKIIKNNIHKLSNTNMSTLLRVCPNICDIVDEDFLNNYCDDYGYYSAWTYIVLNPFAIKLLERNIDIIKEKKLWNLLCQNSAAIHILDDNLDKINWYTIGTNSNAFHLIDKIDTSNYQCFCRNTNPKFLEIVEQNLDEISFSTKDIYCDWYTLSKNPSAINILKNNLDKVLETVLLNPNAIEIIEIILEKIKNNTANSYWKNIYYSGKFFWLLCENPNAIHIIENNMNKINYSGLSGNSNAMHLLVKFDYDKMKELNKEFNEELVAYVFNPNRLLRFCENYGLTFYEINEIY